MILGSPAAIVRAPAMINTENIMNSIDRLMWPFRGLEIYSFGLDLCSNNASRKCAIRNDAFFGSDERNSIEHFLNRPPIQDTDANDNAIDSDNTSTGLYDDEIF